MKMRGSGLFIVLLIGALFAYRAGSDIPGAEQAKQNQCELLTAVDSFKGAGTLVTPIKVVSNGIQLPECTKQNSCIYCSATLAITQNTGNTYRFALPFYKYRVPAYIVFRSLLI